MTKAFKRGGIVILFSMAIYCAGTVGCLYFPALSQTCGQTNFHLIVLSGLMYWAIFLALIGIPIAMILFLRITVVLPISAFIYGNYRTLDNILFAWNEKKNNR